MGIFLLFIPLILFIIIEGAILFILTNMIFSALATNDFSSTVMVDYDYPVSMATLYIFLLMIGMGVAICLYIMLVIRPALREEKRKKAELENKSSGDLAGFGNLGDALGQPGESGKKRFKVTGVTAPVRRKKSKKLLIIIIAAVLAIIIGAAAFWFIVQPDWLPDLFGSENGGNNNTPPAEDPYGDPLDYGNENGNENEGEPNEPNENAGEGEPPDEEL